MKLVFDIETVGEDFDSIDDSTKENLMRWLKREAQSETEYNSMLEDLKNSLGFSPLTGKVVAVGVLDISKNNGVVYYSTDDNIPSETEEDNFKFKIASEAEMLEKFWQGAKEYSEFISFNGRSFDVPFLMIRSAINRIKPTIDLLSYRYLNMQKGGAVHIDLFDQLSFYGAVRKKSSLHLWCRAFGIPSPKADVTGDDVARLFKEKQFLKIAKYNTRDLIATKELYNYWYQYLKM